MFRFTSRDGLYSDQAFQILEDGRGRLWMNCNKGIYHVAKKDLLAFAAGRLSRIPCVSFGKSEGIKVTESSGPAQPAGCIDRQGRIWFPTIRGLSMFDPDRLRINRVEPPLVIEKLVINDRKLATTGAGDRPAGKGQHRDRLHGHQLPAGGQNAVRLSPGRLRPGLGPGRQPPFRVLYQPAARRSTLSGSLPAMATASGTAAARRVTFMLRPYFVQTALFRWLVVLAACCSSPGFFSCSCTAPNCASESWSAWWTNAPCSCKHLARYDGLTDLANHRTFYEIFQKEWAVAGREKKPLSLIAVDIDFFKPYNDTLGHQEGDECLRKVAQAIRAHVKRPADLAARTGGDEFFLLLPATETDGALAMAKAIQAAIARAGHPPSRFADRRGGHARVSALPATIPAPGAEANHFIAHADQALYRTKQQGRNRIGDS